MHLVRAIGASTLAKRQDCAALPDIMGLAQANNEQHHLTGLLVFSSKDVLRAIEGGRQAVTQLLLDMQALSPA